MNLDDTDRDLTLDDIGYWSIPEVDETEEEEIHDDVDRNFSGLLIVESKDTMTLLVPTYTVPNITTDTQEAIMPRDTESTRAPVTRKNHERPP